MATGLEANALWAGALPFSGSHNVATTLLIVRTEELTL
jgi:hypothetical protein